jgi:hypothetical protein
VIGVEGGGGGRACGAYGVRCLKERAKKRLKERGEKDRSFFCVVSEGKSGEENEVCMRTRTRAKKRGKRTY